VQLNKLEIETLAMRAGAAAPKHYADQIVDSLPSGVMVIDASGTVRTINPAMRAMLGSVCTLARGAMFPHGLRSSELRPGSAPPWPRPTADQPDFLRVHRCNQLQGFFIVRR
jgi:PAS domain-containing protein